MLPQWSVLEFLRDACISRHGQFELRSDDDDPVLDEDHLENAERCSDSDDDPVLENESKVDAELDMCKEILHNEIGNANQKGASYGKIRWTKST